MSRAGARVVTVLLTASLAAGLGGCRNIPKSASTKDFCSAGEKFSASTTFTQGVSRAKKLSEVGTPAGIPKAARDGFVELVDRVLSAKDGKDFRTKTSKLSKQEQKNLAALSVYIQKTCKL